MDLATRISNAVERYQRRKPAAGQKSLFDETKHPRGQPDNAGQFVEAGKQSAKTDQSDSPANSDSEDYKKNGTKAKAFKTWFGDWEHDSEKSSKVVKHDGSPQETHSEPLIVTHGTPHKFEKFEHHEDKNNGKVAGVGFYFAEDKRISDSWKTNWRGGDDQQPGVIQAYLNIRKPFDFDQPIDPDEADRIAAVASLTKRAIFNEDKFSRLTRDSLNRAGWYAHNMRLWDNLKTALGGSEGKGPNHVNDVLEAAGYDGIKHTASSVLGDVKYPTANYGGDYGTVWVAFRANQIKSIDNRGTFDPKDDRFKYSARVNGAVEQYRRIKPASGQKSLFDESKHPRGQPENAGQFVEANQKASSQIVTDDTPPAIKAKSAAEQLFDAKIDYRKNGVRAARFKAWFGDWENNPAQASKVVQESGEPQETHAPMKAMHGTTHRFQKFEYRAAGRNGMAAGKGFYFAEDKRIAENWKSGRFGEENGLIVTAYLNIRQPFDFDRFYTKDEAHSLADKIMDTHKQVPDASITTRGRAAVHKDIDRSISRYGDVNGYQIWEWIGDRSGEFRQMHIITGLLEAAGFDGVCHHASTPFGDVSSPRDLRSYNETTPALRAESYNPAKYGRVWVSFRANQIKSVDNLGTFDPEDDRMHYSRTNQAIERYHRLWSAGKTQSTDQIDKRCGVVTDPSEDQSKAGNYQKAHITVHGLKISIENPKGSVRSGTAKDGTKWSQTMKNHYGYITRTVGADGDHVDVFIGPNPNHPIVYVIDQYDPDTWTFDEVKCIIGARSKDEAKQIYLSNYQKGWQGFHGMAAMHARQFQHWLKHGDMSKPVCKNCRR